jgi:hypothetical protein
MKTKRLAIYCLAGLVAGCVPIVSLHPLFTKDDLAFDEKLLGIWLEDVNSPEPSWEFARMTEADAGNLPDDLKSEFKRVYRLNVTDEEGHRGSFAACLVKLGNRMFLDVLPDALPSGERDMEKAKLLFNAFLFLPAHTFVRVDAIGDQLKMRLTNDDEFKKLVEAEPKAVTYTEVSDRFVLTGETKELQAFVTKYADDSRLFPGEMTLTRKGK